MKDKATKRNRRGALVVLCSFALAGLAIPSGLELAVADGNNVISCADLVFGTTASSSGNQVSPSDSTDYSSIYSSNVVSGLGATGWIGKTSGLSYALRIGSASSKSSSFTANFSSALNLDGVYAYCGKYASGDTANLTASTPGQTLSSTSLSAFYSDSTIDISSLDKALYFPLSGAAASSFTLAGDNRFYCAKLVFKYSGSGELITSSSPSGASSSESPSSTSSSSSGSSASYYRVAAPEITTAASALVYDVSFSGGSYYGVVSKTIYKDQDYIEPADVAQYFLNYGTYPQNYFLGGSCKSQALAYGTSGRCAYKYTFGSYSGSNDYSPNLKPVKGETYYELDISTSSYNSSYNNGSSITRGTFRVVGLPSGASTSYSGDRACFFTDDHYVTFSEYYNYGASWSPDFNGSGSSSSDRVVPSTVTYSF